MTKLYKLLSEFGIEIHKFWMACDQENWFHQNCNKISMRQLNAKHECIFALIYENEYL